LPHLQQPKSALPLPRFYEPELDLLRFCAFLAVFFYHSLPNDYSALIPHFGHAIPALITAIRNALPFGVCMFFLLSSYLITKLLVLERANTGSIDMRNFYIRRILRIWPLYLTFLLLMFALGRAHIFTPFETGRLLAFLFFAGNIYNGLFGFSLNPISILWTISIEEQFYILWPGLARIGTLFLKRAAWIIVAIAALSAVLLGLYAASPRTTVWTSSLVHFQFFALGALLAIHFSKGLPAYSTATRALFAVAGTALCLIASGPLHINREPVLSPYLLALGYELMACGIVLLFLVFLGATQGRNRIPASLTYLGKISYGLYVFHQMALDTFQAIAIHYNIHLGLKTIGGAAFTLLLAMLSYRFFEKPFLVLKDRFSPVLSPTHAPVRRSVETPVLT
jgi:peptidoglycan/LPS O-acetylase OafA/YrhL